MRCWPSSRPCSFRAAAVWEALWGSTPIITGMRAPFSKADRKIRRAGRLGAGQTSVEPLPVGCRQDRTTVLEPTQTSSGSGGCGATCRHPGTLRLQPQGSYRPFNKSVGSDESASRCAHERERCPLRGRSVDRPAFSALREHSAGPPSVGPTRPNVGRGRAVERKQGKQHEAGGDSRAPLGRPPLWAGAAPRQPDHPHSGSHGHYYPRCRSLLRDRIPIARAMPATDAITHRAGPFGVGCATAELAARPSWSPGPAFADGRVFPAASCSSERASG